METSKCQSMKVSELKKELEALGISTTSFFEKSDFVKALAEARADGVTAAPAPSAPSPQEPDVVIPEIVSDSAGPRPDPAQQEQPGAQGNPFGGGGNPFGGGGMPGGVDMGNLQDMLKNMGMGGGAPGGDPFGGGGNPFGGGGNPFGGGAPGGNPFGGGMPNPMEQAQEMMKNPKIQEIMGKASSNPRVMAALQECMSNPAAMAKYANDPEIMEMVREIQKAQR